jgi:broad specificity phosphatase PhoE
MSAIAVGLTGRLLWGQALAGMPEACGVNRVKIKAAGWRGDAGRLDAAMTETRGTAEGDAEPQKIAQPQKIAEPQKTKTTGPQDTTKPQKITGPQKTTGPQLITGQQKTIVHLLRHGEVHNPTRVIYGRLPDFHLSEDGRMMAKAAAGFLAGRDVAAVFSSPLDRARETAEPVAAQFGLKVVVDERLIEPWNHFEGLTFGVGDGSLRRVRHWRHLYNPFRPSWGEPYRQIADRMLAAMADARDAALGHEVVCVSHQLPIWTARRAAENRKLWHHPARRECALASVTSFTYCGGRITEVAYAEPAGPTGRHIPRA